jgi:hypothetical protein
MGGIRVVISWEDASYSLITDAATRFFKNNSPYFCINKRYYSTTSRAPSGQRCGERY